VQRIQDPIVMVVKIIVEPDQLEFILVAKGLHLSFLNSLHTIASDAARSCFKSCSRDPDYVSRPVVSREASRFFRLNSPSQESSPYFILKN
jgi:hypothetical protein